MPFAGNFHPEWGYLAPAPSFMRTVRIVIVATAVGATAGAGVVLTLAERSNPPTANGKVVVVRSLVQPAEAAIATVGAPPAATAALPAAAAPATNQAPVNAARTNQAKSGMARPGQTATNQLQTVPLQASPAPTNQAEAAPASGLTAASPAAVALTNTGLPAVQSASVAAPAAGGAASDSHTTSTSEAPTGIAALSESPPALESAVAPPLEAMAPEQPAPSKSKKRRAARPREPQGYGAPDRRRAANADRGGLGPLLQHLFSAHAGPSYYQN